MLENEGFYGQDGVEVHMYIPIYNGQNYSSCTVLLLPRGRVLVVVVVVVVVVAVVVVAVVAVVVNSR